PVEISGWAVSPSRVVHVEISIDGRQVAVAPCVRLRMDVGSHYPSIPDAEHSGFGWTWNTAHVPDGAHSITLRAVTADNRARTLTGTVTVDNATVRKGNYENWIEMFEP